MEAAIASEADVDATAAAVYSAGEHGNLVDVDALLARLKQAPGERAAAWALALRALRWSFDPGAAPCPGQDEVRRFVPQPDGVRAIAARTCSVMERACISALDVARLGAWTEIHAALVPPAGQQGTPPDVSLASALLWRRFLAGESAGQDLAAKALFEEASRQRAAAQVIESTVVRALLALSAGSIDDAVELARRASRMAQSESLPQLEYLANLALARVRRYSGRPHLALHILNALSRIAPAGWSGWIAWETLLGGGDGDFSRVQREGELGAAPAVAAARDLAALLRASRDGDRDGFARLATALARTAGFWPDLAREAEALVAALDPARSVPGFALAWFRGETVTIPCGLHGIGAAAQSSEEGDAATAFVVATPGAAGRRILRPALAFATWAQLLARDTGKAATGGVRTETGVAALALAGDDGQTREDFFHSVYGFPFVAQRHQAVLDVLCMRMRGLLGDAGHIRRDPGAGAAPTASAESHAGRPSLALTLRSPIVVADMRCALPTADRVLRMLAKLGATSAGVAADSLRMPLRTVQAVLQQLVAEGACSTERDGRRVSYRVEDTTFTEVRST